MAQRRSSNEVSLTDFLSETHLDEAIRQYSNPDHPEQIDADELGDVLRQFQEVLADDISWFYSSFGSGNVIYEDRGVVIYGDCSDEKLDELFERADVTEGSFQTLVKGVHRNYAEDFVEPESWTSNSIVVVKPREFRNAERALEHRFANLIREAELSPAELIDYWMTDVRGKTQASWANSRGHESHQSVGRNAREARRKQQDSRA